MAEAVAAGAPLEAVRGGVFAGWEEGNFESAVRHSASRWARVRAKGEHACAFQLSGPLQGGVTWVFDGIF